MTAEEFLKNIEPKTRGSKIEPYFQDILKLRKAGLSYNQILEFLRINGVVVTYSTLADYLRRHAPIELQGTRKTESESAQKKPDEKRVTPPEKKAVVTNNDLPKPPAKAPADQSYFEKKKPVKFDPTFLESED